MRIAAEGRGEETAAARLAVDVDEDLAAVVAASRAAGRPAWEDHLRALLEVGLSRR